MRGNLFCFFFLPHKERGNPAHKTTHLQTAASQPCKPKFAKELFFCPRTHYHIDKFSTFRQNRQNEFDKMKTFGEYLRKIREEKELPLRKVAAALDIDTSILSKIERNERRATTDMLPIIAETLEKTEKEVQIEFIKSLVHTELGGLDFLKDGLNETLSELK